MLYSHSFYRKLNIYLQLSLGTWSYYTKSEKWLTEFHKEMVGKNKFQLIQAVFNTMCRYKDWFFVLLVESSYFFIVIMLFADTRDAKFWNFV